MIKAHNIRHALLGAVAFIVIGSFGACSTDPTAPSMGADANTAPTASITPTDQSGQTLDGGIALATDAVSTLAKPKCILLDGIWHCTNEN
ncbi:MAG: hypothetical protein P8Z36_09515 [Gemmatimonadota bacterium]|jgi:hypothetical protein